MWRRGLLVVMMAALLALCMSARPIAAGMDGVIMKRGKMMMMKAGKAMDPMTASMTMSNGAVVMVDGTVKLPDGQELRLKDGQMMMMDGKMMEGGKAMEMEKKY